MIEDRLFTDSEGANWIRLTGLEDSSPIWLMTKDIRSVARVDSRSLVFIEEEGIVPVGMDKPSWVTQVETSGLRWVVQESVEEVRALQMGNVPDSLAMLAEPPSIEIVK